MRILIVEDEILLAKRLKSLVQEVEPEAEVVGHTNSIAATVNWLEHHGAPDVIFMDIELADGQCFEIFKQATIKTPVIFTTAYDEYALQAFKVNSIDYLLKPISTVQLAVAINKFKEWHRAPHLTVKADIEVLIQQLQKVQTGREGRERFLVKQGQKMISVNTKEVAFFSAKNTLNFLTTKEKQKFIIDYTLDDIESSLDSRQFFRINRQYIVAHDIITAVHTWFNGKLKLDVAIPVGEELIISRERAPSFKMWMGS